MQTRQDATAGYRLASEVWARVWAPRQRPTITQWADANRQVVDGPMKGSAWRTSRTPFLAAIQDSLLLSHPAPIIIVPKSSQVGGTSFALNWIGRTIDVEPDSFLALFPSDKDARKWTRNKLNKMIATTPSLRSRITLSQRTHSGNSLSEKQYAHGTLYTGSANIPTDVASITVPYLVLDEVDRMILELEDEGDPIELAMRRSATFTRRKALLISTPTGENSRIWSWWQKSTKDRYFVPCPHCGHMQYLRWQQLAWPEGKPKQATYLCEHEDCAALIEEHAKPDILAAGEWRAEHPEREAEIKGFHVNGLYTPIGLGDTWAMHAAAWERAQGKAARLQVFYNTRLGEVYSGDRRSVDWEDLKRRAEPYPLRTLAPGVLILTSSTDVQKDRLETQVVGWGRNEQATVVDYVVHSGDPTRPEVWAELDAYLAREIPSAGGVPMRITCALVDSNYLTDHVLNFTRPVERRARGIFASLGSTMATRDPIGRPKYPDMKRRGRKMQADRRGVERYTLGVSKIKTWVFDQLRADVAIDGAFVPPADRHIRLPSALSDVFFRGFASEVYDSKTGWEVVYERNEPLDTFVGARAAALHPLAGVDRLREPDWIRLEQLYEPKGDAKAAPKQGGGAPPSAPGGGFMPSPAVTDN